MLSTSALPQSPVEDMHRACALGSKQPCKMHACQVDYRMLPGKVVVAALALAQGRGPSVSSRTLPVHKAPPQNRKVEIRERWTEGQLHTRAATSRGDMLLIQVSTAACQPALPRPFAGSSVFGTYTMTQHLAVYRNPHGQLMWAG